jgi:hypothetical protein
MMKKVNECGLANAASSRTEMSEWQLESMPMPKEFAKNKQTKSGLYDAEEWKRRAPGMGRIR